MICWIELIAVQPCIIIMPHCETDYWCSIYMSDLYLLRSSFGYFIYFWFETCSINSLRNIWLYLPICNAVKGFICTYEQYIVMLYIYRCTSVLTLVPNNIFHYTKKWHTWHEKISFFSLSQNIPNIGWIFFCHIKVNGFSWKQEKGCLSPDFHKTVL